MQHLDVLTRSREETPYSIKSRYLDRQWKMQLLRLRELRGRVDEMNTWYTQTHSDETKSVAALRATHQNLLAREHSYWVRFKHFILGVARRLEREVLVWPGQCI